MRWLGLVVLLLLAGACDPWGKPTLPKRPTGGAVVTPPPPPPPPPPPANAPPVADARFDRTVGLAEPVVLDGRGSYDLDGEALTFRWAFAARPAGSVAALDDAGAILPAFTPDLPGSYEIELTVSNGRADSPPAPVTITTAPGNSRPRADAGPDQAVAVGARVVLDGTASSDMDGDLLSYTWTLTERPAGSSATLDDAASPRPTFHADQAGIYVATLAVRDGALTSAAASVRVVAGPGNVLPRAHAGYDQRVLQGETVFLDGSASSDANGDALGYRWSFVSRPAGSAATLTDADRPDAQFMADVAGHFLLQLSVRDATGAGRPATVLITVEDGNTPPRADAGADQEVPAGSMAYLDGTDSADADGDALDYVWALIARPPSSGAELSAVGPLVSIGTDRRGWYVGQLVVNDGRIVSRPDTVSVLAVNTAPVARAGTDQAVAVGATVQLDGTASSDPNGDPITYSWALTGVPGGSTASLDGAATATPTFIADRAGTYTATLVVADDLLSSASSSVNVVATTPGDAIDPDADLPAPLQLIPLPDRTVRANERLTAAVQVIATPPADVELALSGAPAGMALAGAILDWTPVPAQAGAYPVTVTASADGVASTSTSFTVTVVHQNRAPALAPQPDVNVLQGQPFVRLLTATDPDPGDAVTVALVAGPTGMTLESGALNWETVARPVGDYPVTVRATDAEGLTDTRSFLVRILPPQAPVALDDFYRVVVGETLTVGPDGVLGNDLSPYQRPLTSALDAAPALGTLAEFREDGSFVYQAPAEQPERPFELVRRWTSPVHPNVYTGFVAGDVNGDGVPDIVYHDQVDGFIARDGATGDLLWSRVVSFFCQHLSLPLLADIDDDGRLELVATDCGPSPNDSGQNVLVVLDARNGAELRRAHISELFEDVLPAPRHLMNGFGSTASAGITLARLAGNGPPRLLFKQEIAASAGFHTRASDGANVSAGCAGVTGDPAHFGQACRVLLIIDPVTLAKETTLVAPLANTFTSVETAKAAGIYHGTYMAPVVADLDGDGQVEIVSGGDVWRQVNGAWELAWSSVRTPASTAVADLDGDGTLEVIQSYTFEPALLSGGSAELPCGLYIYGAAGELRRAISLPTCAHTGNLTVADVDGDGAPEILLTRAGSVHAVRADGRSLWTFDVPDTSATLPSLEAEIGRDARIIQPPGQRTGGAFVVVYDLDGDGAAEVVVNTQSGLFVLDGRNGEQRAVYGLTGYQGQFNIPVTLAVLDLDNDGTAHLVVRGGCPYLLFQNELEYCNGQITVLSPAQGAWLPGPKSYPQGNYLDGQIDDADVLQFNPPVGGLFRTPRQRGTIEDPRRIGADTFSYTASDGQLTSTPATVAIQIDPPNRPPRLTNALSVNFTRLGSFQLQLLAVDPDPGDTLTFSRGDNSLFCAGLPPQVGASTGVLTCNFPTATYEPATVTVRVTDSFGAFDQQTLRFFPLGAPLTVPGLLGLGQGEATDTLVDAGLRLGEVVTFFSPAPAGTVIGQNPLPGAASNANALVDLTVSLGPQPTAMPALVGRSLDRSQEVLAGLGFEFEVVAVVAPGVAGGQVLAQTPSAGELARPGAEPVTLTVAAGEVPSGTVVGITVEPGSAARLVGDRLPLRAFAEFSDGSSADVTLNAVWTSSANGVVTVNGVGLARALTPGAATITATLGAASGQATLAIVSQVADVTPPVALISTPLEDAEVTAPTTIVGTASDANFHRYDLAVSQAGEARWTIVAEGITPVTDGALGQFDPATLLNGPYEIRLRVYDRGGNMTEASRAVLVDGDRKVGLFSLTYRDVDVALAGLPITILRTYDSRDKGRGEFGVGWRLGYQSLQLRTNRVLGTAWLRSQNGAASSLTPRAPHWVSVTLPDGTVEVFDLELSPTGGLGVLQTTRVVGFTPRPGVRGTLEMLDNPDLVIFNQGFANVLVDDTTLEVFDPKLFRYTTPEGTRTLIHRSEGIRSITDAAGNAITFGPDGITHSGGQSVRFTRDAEGRITSVRDLNGGIHTYRYDGRGDLVRHEDPTGALSRYVYNRSHGLVEIYDALGVRMARNAYDVAGRLISVTDAAGNAVTFTHNDAEDEEIITDRLGNTTRIIYDAEGNVTRVERPVTIDGVLVNAVTRYAYDAEGNEIEVISPDGITVQRAYQQGLETRVAIDPTGLNLVTQLAYDARDNVTELLDPLGRRYEFAYDMANGLISANVPGHGATSVTSDARGLPQSSVDAAGTRTEYHYDGAGRVVREDTVSADGALLRRIDRDHDAMGNVVRETLYRTDAGVTIELVSWHRYDAANRRVETTDPEGGIWRWEYDAAGRLLAEINPLGRRTSHSYDLLGRRAATIYADGSGEYWDHDAENRLVASTDRGGRVTRFAYDELGRQVRTTRPDGATQHTVYSPGGRLIASIDGHGHRTEYTHDSAGRRIGMTLPAVADGPGGALRRPHFAFELDAQGVPIARTDPIGRRTTFGYDSAGRLIETIHPDGAIERQEWDALGRLARVVNAEGQTTSRQYDGLGRLVVVTGLAGNMQYDYDEAGNLVRQTDALGRATTFRYDRLNRLIEQTYPNGDRVRMHYDAIGNLVARTDGLGRVTTFTYDAVRNLTRRTLPDGNVTSYGVQADGKLTSVQDTRGLTTFAYDPAGRLIAKTDPVLGVLGYSYDANGHVTSITAPAGATGYVYDALGRPVVITTPEGMTGMDYDLAGNLVRLARWNGVVSEAEFDARNRMSALRHVDASGTLLQAFDIDWSDANRRTRVTDSTGAVETFEYDEFGRLTRETRTGPASHSIAHAYDAVGNRVMSTRNGLIINYAYDANDRLLSGGPITYRWNANGNLVERTQGAAVERYGYDPLDRLVAAETATGTYRYQYDAMGNRVERTGPAGTTRFLVDGLNPTGHSQTLEERDGAGNLEARYSWARGLIGIVRGGAPRAPLGDGKGNVGALVNGNGVVTDTYRYDAYGETLAVSGSTNNAYRYRQEHLDTETGHYYLRARQYAPEQAGFLTRDPFAGTLEIPLSRHRYLYANADPVNHLDPSGMTTLTELSFVQALQSVLRPSQFYTNLQIACNAKASAEQAVNLATLTQEAIVMVGHAAVMVAAVQAAIGGFSVDVGFETAEFPRPGLKKFGLHLVGSGRQLAMAWTFDFHQAPQLSANVTMLPPPVSVSGALALNGEQPLKNFDYCGLRLGQVVLKGGGQFNLGWYEGVGGGLGTGVSVGMEASFFRGSIKLGWPLYSHTTGPQGFNMTLFGFVPLVAEGMARF